VYLWNILFCIVAWLSALIVCTTIYGLVNLLIIRFTGVATQSIQNLVNFEDELEPILFSITGFVSTLFVTLLLRAFNIELSGLTIICLILPVFFQQSSKYLSTNTLYYSLSVFFGLFLFLSKEIILLSKNF